MAIGFNLDDMEIAGLSNPQEIYELNKRIRNLKKQLETAREEAIKEFAEVLKKNEGRRGVPIAAIDRLVKEMTDGHEAE
jgi:hypothetical protein